MPSLNACNDDRHWIGAPKGGVCLCEAFALGSCSPPFAAAIAQAGVEVWFYQDGARFEYGSFAANITGIVRAEMNAEFRRQIATWTTEAMLRKAKAGHVAGGKTFGYENVRVGGHVERQINAAEAPVVRQIFGLCADAIGQTRIAKQLNAEHAQAPRAQQGRPRAWAPSSVHEILYRDLYRGVAVWNKTKKRNARGVKQPTDRPRRDWIEAPVPHLQIVSDELWGAAHRRLQAARAQYEQDTQGQRRPRRDRDSKYLLPSFGRCALCRGGLHVRSRAHGTGARRARHFFYACTSHYNRGPEVCPHVDQWPMEALDQEVLAAIAGDAFSPVVMREIVTAAREMYEAEQRPDDRDRHRRELEITTRELARLTDAVAAGGDVPVLVERLRATEAKRRQLAALVEARQDRQRPAWREIEDRIRQSLDDWRSLLTGDVPQVRDGFRRLLTGPILFTPFVERGRRGIRFEGRIGLGAILGGELVMSFLRVR